MLEVLMTKNENNSHAFMKKMAENIKLTKDAQSPDESKANEVKYILDQWVLRCYRKRLSHFFLLHNKLYCRMFIKKHSQFLLYFITVEFYYLRSA